MTMQPTQKTYEQLDSELLALNEQIDQEHEKEFPSRHRIAQLFLQMVAIGEEMDKLDQQGN